jgi:cytochrome c oxidase subunit III
MIALPAAPAAQPKRQLFVGTALASAAAAMAMGGMMGLWLRWRKDTISVTGRWLPEGSTVPEVTTNIMLIAFLPIGVFAQWAVYSARRQDKPHTAVALALTGILGLAVINAQAFTWSHMKVGLADSTFGAMFYAITGLFTVLLIVGVIFSAVTMFRYLGGREGDREILSAHAMYWYALSAIFVGLWLVVYVTK